MEERKAQTFLLNPFQDLRETAECFRALADYLTTEAQSQLPRKVRRFVDRVLFSLQRKVSTLDPDTYWNLLKATGPDRKALSVLLKLLGSAKSEKESLSLCSMLLRAFIKRGYDFDEATDAHPLLMIVPALLQINRTYSTWRIFLGASIKGSAEARELLFHWFEVWNQLTERNIVIVPLSSIGPVELLSIPEILQLFLRVDKSVGVLTPDEYVRELTTLFREFKERIETLEQEKLRFLLWFQENRTWFEEAWARMWEEIKTKRSYGLRPKGLDMIRIGIVALQSEDWRFTAIEYLGEVVDPDSPKVKVRFWSEFAGEISAFTWTLQSGTKMTNPLYAQREGEPLEILDACLAYIAVHGYWRIVTRKKTPLPTKPPTGVRPKSSEIPKEWTSVRWHFRKVPRESSEAAKARALELAQVIPPPGMTFVRPHVREIAKIKSGEALFTYKESDIGYPG